MEEFCTFKHLIDLRILGKDGRVIFSKADQSCPDDHLVGRLISALNNYTQSRFDEPLLRFSTDMNQYYIIEQQGILFIGIFPRDKTIQEDSIIKGLKDVRDRFFSRFTEENLDMNILEENSEKITWEELTKIDNFKD
jgi:hypothetical protein